MDWMSNDTTIKFQPLVFTVDGGDIFFSVSASEGWSLGANEIFSDLDFCTVIREIWQVREVDIYVLVLHKHDFIAWDVKPLLLCMSEELMFVYCEFRVTNEWVRGIVILWHNILSLRLTMRERRIKGKERVYFFLLYLYFLILLFLESATFSWWWGVELVDAVQHP